MKCVTVCGVDEKELKNGWCYKCGNGTYCEVRDCDWVSERIFNFCKIHKCLKPFANNVFTYDKWMFLQFLKDHPSEILKRKWLQEIALENHIPF